MGMKIKESRTDKSISEIKLALMGATRNLYLLENALVKTENILHYQYFNYLSQVVFCIEVGLKSIIINTDDFEHIHDIKNLFLITPQEFQQNFRTLYSNEEIFNAYMANTDKLFEDCRYMNSKGKLNEYLDMDSLNSNGTVNIKRVASLGSFQFLREFLNKILQYEESIRRKTVKQMSNTVCSDADSFIKQYSELVKSIQPK